jgi:capsular polysaccharide transport system permease protein
MTTTVPSDTRAATVKQLRRIRARRLILRLGIGVGLPTILAAIYYGLIVTPQYESVTSFTVQSADGGYSPTALQMLITQSSGTASDSLLVLEYIHSRDMMEHLISEHRFAQHYETGARDFMSRLPADASSDAQYEFYRDHVVAEYDNTSAVLTLRVRAFSARQAHAIAQAILAASERMVNDMNTRARNDRIELSQREVDRAEQRLGRARTRLAEAQSRHGELNPVASAEGILTVRSRLEGELAIARAELESLRGTLQPDTQAVQDQRRRVAALQRQIDEQTARLSGPETEDISDTIASFEPIVIEKEFAERAYESAMTSLELARVDADRQHRYLVRIAAPSRPEEAAFPQFWYSVLTVLVLSFALLGIGTLLLASVREHANV